MTITSKRLAARILRAEAESILRHGFTNFFSHSFICLEAQVLRKEACEGCLLRDYVPEAYRNEAFPCQHMDAASCQRLAAVPGLPERIAARWLAIAEELEAGAEAKESSQHSQGSM